MNFIKSLFPFSFRPADGKALILTILIYIAAGAVLALLLGVLSHAFLVGWVFSLLRWIVEVYVAFGVLFAILSYFNVIS